MLTSERQSVVVDDSVFDPLAGRLRAALHEIRQPLAAVFALAECVRATPGLPTAARCYLDRLIEQVEETAEAAASALEQPHRAPDEGPVRLDEVLDSVLASFALTWSGTLVRRGDEGGLAVPGRRAATRRCLVNLLDNAVRAAGPKGTVVVTVRRGPEFVRVVVEDDGPGFGRVPTRTGLGLDLVRQTVEPLGGGLAVQPPAGTGGARVVLSLPLASSVPPVDGTVRAG